MVGSRPLRTLLLIYELIFVLLLMLAVAAGGYGILQWRTASVESVRISRLALDIQQIRGDLYRQMKELFDAYFLADPQASSEYVQYTQQINKRFSRLAKLAKTGDESLVISDMQAAYHHFLKETKTLLETTDTSDHKTLEHIFNSNLELNLFLHYEDVTDAAEKLFSRKQQEIQTKLHQANRTVVILLVVPVILAIVLLLFSWTFLQRAIARPLLQILRATNEIGQGKLEHKVPETGAAELVSLASTINSMADDLAHSRAALVRKEKQAAQGALVPMLAHNIRNPLASIRATAQVADNPSLDIETRHSLKDIIATVDRLERWTGSLLAYLHPQQLQITSISLELIVNAACAVLQPKLDEKHINIEIAGCKGLSVSVDMHLMEQAIYNLLLNALEASPVGGNITIGALQNNETVTLTIADQGPGMPLMPEFNTITPMPSTKRFGTGLGIPFAFKACEAHGGQLHFSNRSGGGTIASLTWPIKPGTIKD